MKTKCVASFAVALLLGIHWLVAADPPVNPGDGREVLRNTKGAPAKYIGLIYFDDPRPPADRPNTTGRIRRCTGFLVGDKHIVTCAHCLAHNLALAKMEGVKPYPLPEKFPNKIYFAPGQHGSVQTPCDGPAIPDSQPYGRYQVVGVSQIFAQYFKEDIPPRLRTGVAKLDRHVLEVLVGVYDLVVLELDRSTRPAVGGHFQFASSSNRKDEQPAKLILNGYDADLTKIESLPGGEERVAMWQMTRTGTITDTIFFPNFNTPNHQARLTCKAFPGASGGPIFVLRAGVPTVVGITLRTDNGRGNEAIGLFFTQKHTQFIQAGLGKK